MYALPHSTQRLIWCVIVLDTVNVREVMLDNLKQQGSVNDEQQGSQTRTLRYATVKWELSRRRPIDGDLLAPIRQI